MLGIVLTAPVAPRSSRPPAARFPGQRTRGRRRTPRAPPVLTDEQVDAFLAALPVVLDAVEGERD